MADCKTGTFSSPSDKTLVKTIDCNDKKGSAIGHSNDSEKESITVSWKAPKGHKSKVGLLGS